MIKDLVNDSALKYILSDIELTCKRLGINAKFSIKTEKDYSGKPYELIESTSFQTMPMLFKEIHIEGNIAAMSTTGSIRVIAILEYRYKTFESGYNGCALGKVIYEVDNMYDGKRPENAHMYIEKIKSINI